MSAWLIGHEAVVRLTAFFGILGLVMLLQWRFPLRGDGRLARRQAVNIGLVLVGTALLRLGMPVLAVGWAIEVQTRGLGVLPWLALPGWAAFVTAVLLLDMVIYFQHRMFHRLPWLWRLHRVHHSDPSFDVSTGVRFHPVELMVSLLIKLSAIAILGAPPVAVLVFELLLSVGALLTHADVALPRRIDHRLRWLLVTPSMHRIHHSPLRIETDSNYGFHLSIWDRLFRSYRQHPTEAERTMTIGLDEWRDPASQGLWALLRQPVERPGAASRRIPHA
jgi:sterol desaturase/sphingolipid hydroxylase (fatty acid hydroxylase superfamily)